MSDKYIFGAFDQKKNLNTFSKDILSFKYRLQNSLNIFGFVR